MRTFGFGYILLASCALLLSACGGGSGAPGSSSATQSTTSIGRATVTYSGKIRSPISDSSNSVTVLGIAGAAFTSVNFNPVKSLDNTKIAFDREGNGVGQIWEMQYPSGTPVEVTHDATAVIPQWGPNGKLSFSTTQDDVNAQDGVLNADGSQTIFPTLGPYYSSFSPDGTHIAYVTLTGTLGVMSSTGTNLTTLDNSGSVAVFPPSWLNNSTILYSRISAGQNLLYSVGTASGTPTQYPTAVQSGNSIFRAVVSPDGQAMALTVGTSGSPPTDVIVSNLNGSVKRSITPTGYTTAYASYSPDGQYLVFERSLSGKTNDGIAGIYISEADGSNPQILAADPSGGNQLLSSAEFVSWQPFPSAQLFVGSGGSLGSSASGFMFGQNGDVFSSFLAFTASTPSSAAITAGTSNGSGGALVYTITADNLSRIVWTNGYYAASTSVSGLTGTGSAIVSFNGATGQVDFVAPVGGPAAPALDRTAGPTLVYNGKFAAIYNSKGVNLALSGASRLQIDAKTGELISFR